MRKYFKVITIALIAFVGGTVPAGAQSCERAAGQECRDPAGPDAAYLILANLAPTAPAPPASVRPRDREHRQYAQQCPIPPRCFQTCGIRVDPFGCIVWNCC